MTLFDRFRKKAEETPSTQLMQSIPMNRSDILQVLLEQKLIAQNLEGWQLDPKLTAYRPYMQNMYMNSIHSIGIIATAFLITKEELDKYEAELTEAGGVHHDMIVPPDGLHDREVG